MSDPRRRAPLAHRKSFSTAKGEAALAEVPFLGKLVLRGDALRIGSAVESVAGAPLPVVPGTTTESAKAVIHWMGPDEWWLTSPAGTERAMQSAFEGRLEGVHSQVADVTEYYTTLALSGSKAREMLMKISTIDLHPRHFTKGQCVTSLFARANPLVRLAKDEQDAGGPLFELTIRISMADYLWCVLAEAGHEWGLPVLEPRGIVKQHLPHFE